ncbi:MAG: alpha/beta fold hydrolase [Bacteroidota bacterium]
MPTVLAKDYRYQFSGTFEELYLETEDGEQLNALHFKRESPKGIVLYFHGNAGDLSRWGEVAEAFINRGFEVIIMDYRSYGKSTGKPTEDNLFKDAQRFYDHTLQRYAQEDIIIYGRSLGAAIATHLAANNHPRQLILETPFYNLLDVAKGRFPFLPVKRLLRYQFASDKHILKVASPIAIFHGTEDAVVPFESGHKLYQIIPNKNKHFFKIPGGRHNDLSDYDGFQRGIDQVLSQTKE